MRLKKKLLLFIIISLFIPMIIVIIISGSFILKSSIESQHQFLKGILSRIISRIKSIESDHWSYISTLSISNFFRKTLWKYYKKEEKINTDTYQLDKKNLNNDLEKILYEEAIDGISIFYKEDNKYVKFTEIGKQIEMPDVIIPEESQKDFKKFNYFLYYDGIYLNTIRTAKFLGEDYALIILQKGFDIIYLSKMRGNENVGVALYSNNKYLFYSLPDIDSYKINKNSIDGQYYYDSYYSGNVLYNIVLYKTVFANWIEAYFIVGASGNIFLQKGTKTIVLISFLSLILIFIASMAFYSFGLYLIKSLGILLNATKTIKGGDFSIKIPLKRNDEIGELSKEFNKMTLMLKEKTEDLKIKNKRLQLLNYYIDAVFHSLLLNTFVIDDDFNIILVNQSAIEALRLSEDYTLKSIFLISFFKQFEGILKKYFKKVLKNNKSLGLNELSYKDKVYSLEFHPVDSADLDLRGIIIIVIDVTERFVMEKALVKSEKLAATGFLAAGIAHEINNPLGIILNYFQLLASGKLTNKEEKEFFLRIESEIKRVNNLVEKLLSFSKDDSITLKLINITELARQVYHLFNPKFTHKKIKTEFSTLSDNYFIMGNTDALKQVLFNILNNAVQSIYNDKGFIKMQLSNNFNSILIKVIDNGEGIDKEVQKQIFQPFFTTKSSNNFGLGLSLSNNIMKKHNGKITIKSKKSEGSTITLYFPKGEEIIE